MPVSLFLQGRDLLLQFTFAGSRAARFRRVGGVHCLEILGEPGIGPRDEFLEFAGIEVLVARVDRLEFAAVNGQQFAAEEFELAAEERELGGPPPAAVSDCLCGSQQWF